MGLHHKSLFEYSFDIAALGNHLAVKVILEAAAVLRLEQGREFVQFSNHRRDQK